MTRHTVSGAGPMTWHTVAVLAKQPVAGRAKTRLIGGAVSPEQAAALAEAALIDTFAALQSLRVKQRVLVLDGCPGEWLPTGWTVRPQTQGLLDERLCHAFDELGRRPAVLVGMDTPQLSASQLTFDADRFDACLGLANDGGYWAIGFNDPRRARQAISGVPMSRADTGRIQLERLQQAGLRVQLLAQLTDVDGQADAELVAQSFGDTLFAHRWRELVAAVASSEAIR